MISISGWSVNLKRLFRLVFVLLGLRYLKYKEGKGHDRRGLLTHSREKIREFQRKSLTFGDNSWYPSLAVKTPFFYGPVLVLVFWSNRSLFLSYLFSGWFHLPEQVGLCVCACVLFSFWIQYCTHIFFTFSFLLWMTIAAIPLWHPKVAYHTASGGLSDSESFLESVSGGRWHFCAVGWISFWVWFRVGIIAVGSFHNYMWSSLDSGDGEDFW